MRKRKQQLKSSLNFNHQVRRQPIKKKSNWKYKTLLLTRLFNMHSNCVNHIFKACYSVLRNSTKYFSIDSRNMTNYGCFQFRNKPYASSMYMMKHSSWNSPNQKSHEFTSLERGGQAVGKLGKEIHTQMVSPYQVHTQMLSPYAF